MNWKNTQPAAPSVTLLPMQDSHACMQKKRSAPLRGCERGSAAQCYAPSCARCGTRPSSFCARSRPSRHIPGRLSGEVPSAAQATSRTSRTGAASPEPLVRRRHRTVRHTLFRCTVTLSRAPIHVYVTQYWCAYLEACSAGISSAGRATFAANLRQVAQSK